MARSRSNPVAIMFARTSLIWLTLGYAATQPALAQDVLTPETAAGLKSVTNIAIDPAGRRVAYVLSVPRNEDDDHGEPYSEIWIANVTGDDARRYTRSKAEASSPRFSPDGARLAFLSKRSEHGDDTQILRYVHWPWGRSDRPDRSAGRTGNTWAGPRRKSSAIPLLGRPLVRW